MIATLAYMSLATVSVDDAVAAHQKSLQDYYAKIKTMHVKYTQRRYRRPSPPENLKTRKRWEDSKNDSSIVEVKHEFWWNPPSIRLDHVGRRDGKEAEHRYILHLGKMALYDPTTKYAEVGQPRGLDDFLHAPPFWIGRRLSGSLDTSLADLLAVPGLVHRTPARPGKEHEVALVVGPGVPREFCSGQFGKRGVGTALFSDSNAILPHEWSTLKPQSRGASASEDAPDPATTYSRHILYLKETREAPNARGGTLPFPFLVIYDGGGYTLEWQVHHVEFNRSFSSSVFELPKGNDVLVSTDEKIAVKKVKTEDSAPRAAERKALLVEADQLLVSAPPTNPQNNSYSWTWYVASGICVLGLAWGVHLVRKGG